VKQKTENAEDGYGDLRYPEEIAMQFVRRVLRRFLRTLKSGEADDKGAGKDI
jgi:hypothetical protein